MQLPLDPGRRTPDERSTFQRAASVGLARTTDRGRVTQRRIQAAQAWGDHVQDLRSATSSLRRTPSPVVLGHLLSYVFGLLGLSVTLAVVDIEHVGGPLRGSTRTVALLGVTTFVIGVMAAIPSRSARLGALAGRSRPDGAGR